MNRRSGSSAVFLCIIMGALSAMCLTLLWGVREHTLRSTTDAVLRLASDSLLSEFDTDIQREYGLFLLQGDDRDLHRKLSWLTASSLQHTDVTGLSVSTDGYRVTSPDAVRDQILHYMTAGGGLLLQRLQHARGSDVQPQEIRRAEDKSSGTGGTMVDHVLRHGPTIASLPSRTIPAVSLRTRIHSAGSKLIDPMQFFRDGTDAYLLSGYVLGTFNHLTIDSPIPHHFFRGEAEYILFGKYSDLSNRKQMEKTLKTLRFAPNLAYLYEDRQMQALLDTAAELLAPGLAGAAAKTAAAAAWAWAESANDARLLLQGFPVPAAKDQDSWALSLENVVQQRAHPAAAGILPQRCHGMTYEQYLRVLLSLQDESLATARILDLIQINMRRNIDGSFLIGEHATGLGIQVTMSGRSFRYDQVYP